MVLANKPKWLMVSGLVILAMIFLGLIFNATNAKALEFSITEDEFNQKLADKLPMIKSYRLLSIKTNVLTSKFLQEGKVALYIEGEVDSHWLKKTPVFKSHVEGVVSFDSENDSVFLKDAKILESNIHMGQKTVSPSVKSIVEKGVMLFLKNKPVYKIKDRNLKEQLAGSFLKEIYIKDDEMHFRF